MLSLLNFVIVVVMIGIIISLGSGLYYLVTDRGKSNRTVLSLTVRVGLAVVLLVVLAYGLMDRYSV